MSTPILQTSGLVSGYVADVDILHGVEIEVASGELVCIIGPNGAGKSTLIKTLAALLRPRAGRIVFDGTDITDRKTHQLVPLGLAYVPQIDNIFPSLTVRENLEMGGFTARRDVAGRLEEVFERLPLLAERQRQRAGTLSGGQRQLLALGRALMSRPSMLMLDEPSAGLAPTVVDMVFETIAEINAAGIAVLLIEQNARRALAMSDRGYVLDLGRNRFDGPGASLLHDAKVAELYLGGARRLEEPIDEEP